ncbi:MAG TPA: PP2C family protein-serine/threonine phosphatase [Acidobacteriaceae bacterium]
MRNQLTRWLLALVFTLFAQFASAQTAAPALAIQDLGKGAVALDGPWQFHLGDDPSFASPIMDDAAGHNGWEQLTADAPWGAQGHRSYVGYAWYRKHLIVTPAPGVEPNWSLLFPHVSDVYSIYWNGRLLATRGGFPPNPTWRWFDPYAAFPAGALGDGVLAIRVYKYPLGSYESGLRGGLYTPPRLGSAAAIAREQTVDAYTNLLGNQFNFGIDSLESLVLVLCFIAWWRGRSQSVLVWTGLFCLSQVALSVFYAVIWNPFSFRWAQSLDEPLQALQDVSLWLLLLWLFELQDDERIVRWTRILIIVDIVAQFADGSTCLVDWSNPRFTLPAQVADGIFTVIYSVAEFWPVVLVLFAMRKRLTRSAWLVAGFAVFANFTNVLPILLEQGSRFTGWTIGLKLHQSLFTLAGTTFNFQNLSNTGLLLAIICAVFSYSRQALARKQSIEQELRSAQELLQVLIPEALPSLPGYALTSSYRPAQEVGGDFFQIIPAADNSWVIALGDVSGKGLRAAMAVSLIVGTIRTLAETDPSPAAILGGLNRRLHNRLQGGFATCVVLHLDAQGRCTLANAGHPAPFLNGREIALAGSLPLGLEPETQYEESQLQLQIEDFLILYTDGLLEARNAQGEIFSFQRLASLVADRPSAAEALQAAQDFGQEDDITVLTLTRLAAGEKSTTELIAPVLVPA